MFGMKYSLWLMASLPVLASARNCTYPFTKGEDVGWQHGACFRGSWAIISNCVMTIVACTWSIQHLNVPARDDNAWTKTLRKIKWMLVTALFPEWIFIHSLFQFYMALTALGLMKDNGKAVKWPWWFRRPPVSWLPFARQRLGDGESGSESRESDPEKQPTIVNPDKKWTITHCYFANMGGFIQVKAASKPGDKETSYPLTARQLAIGPYLYPPATSADIRDKSKQDWLAKLIAGAQISQLILSLLTRRIQRAAFSQLETVTLYFAVCGVLIYYMNFYKPQNVDRAVVLTLLEESPPENSSSSSTSRSGEALSTQQSNSPSTAASHIPSEDDCDWESLISTMFNRPTATAVKGGSFSGNLRPVSRIPNDNISRSGARTGIHPAIYLLAVTSGLFGALHAIAWNFEFPTPFEKLVWQAATVVSTVSPIAGLLMVPLVQLTRSAGDPEIFLGKCLWLLREVAWHDAEDMPVRETMAALEGALTTAALLGRRGVVVAAVGDAAPPLPPPRPQDYTDLLGMKQPRRKELIARLEEYLSPQRWGARFPRSGGCRLRDDREFVADFGRLLTVLRGDGTKRLRDAATARAWPRKPIFPVAVNHGILYLTSALYCLSRMALIAVAASSFRKMPASVYMETNWTRYIPMFSAGGS